MKMIDYVITCLYEVPGRTNDVLRLYPEKASVYVSFKDARSNLRLMYNICSFTENLSELLFDEF